MIATWRGLAIAAAIAVALAAIVAVDAARGGEPGAVDRALIAGFDPARATELIWERAGQPTIRAVRTGERWELRAPGAIPADAGAIGDVLATLRGARWHRRGDAPPPHATLTVVAGGERHVLGIAAPLAGTEQSWIVAGGRGALVDSWVTRALDRDRLSLQIRRPLAEVAGARSIAVSGAPAGGDLQIEGTPRRLVRPIALWLAPEAAGALDRALRDLTIVRIPEGPVAGRAADAPLSITVTGAATGEHGAVSVAIGAGCPGAPDLVAVTGSDGDGCVERAAADAVTAAVAALHRPPDAIADRRPVPFEPAHLVLPDGAALDTSPPRIGDAPADATRLAELLAALAAPAEVVRLPAAPPTARLTAQLAARPAATDRGGAALTLDLFADRVVARHGEPVALRPAPGAWALLIRPSRELRELTLWVEEPTTITALVVDGVRYQRGQVIGAWTRQPAGPPDTAHGAAPINDPRDATRGGGNGPASPGQGGRESPPSIEGLAAQLAAPHALGFADGPFTAAHRVAIEVTPPVGAPSRHALELGAPRAAGCPVRAGGDAVLLPAAVCTAVAALAR